MPNRALQLERTTSAESVDAFYRRAGLARAAEPGLTFALALPQTWQHEILDRAPTAEAPIVPLMRAAAAPYTGYEDSSTVGIVVWCARLECEMHPCDWLSLYMMERGHRPIDSRDRETPMGIARDAITESSGPAGKLVHRLTTFKDGNRIFLFDGRWTPSSAYRWEDAQEAFLIAIQSFELLDPGRRPFAEPFSWHAAPGPGGLSLLLPDSWEKRADGDAPPGGGVLQVRRKFQETTVLRMTLVQEPADETSSDLLVFSLEKLQASGFTNPVLDLDSVLLMTRDFKTAPAFGTVEYQGRTYGLTTMRFQRPGLSAVLFGLGPQMEEDFFLWAGNRRGFEVAAQSFGSEAVPA